MKLVKIKNEEKSWLEDSIDSYKNFHILSFIKKVIENKQYEDLYTSNDYKLESSCEKVLTNYFPSIKDFLSYKQEKSIFYDLKNIITKGS
jgi:hypothetical protein